MKIAKLLNNNVVVAIDTQGNERVVMGRGLAFKKKAGDLIDENLIEKIFAMKSDDISQRLTELLSEIPVDVIATSDRIINLARKQLPGTLQDSIYITLTDHCHFALERFKRGAQITNILLWEIRQLYPDEYAVGLKALDIIEQRQGVRLPDDEAGFIALHFVNAQLGSDMRGTVKMTKVIQEILNIVKHQLHISYDEQVLNYHRFVTHLKFFTQRMMCNNTGQTKDPKLHEMVCEQYPIAYRCAEKVKLHIKIRYNYEFSTDELTFLTIHIERLRADMEERNNR